VGGRGRCFFWGGGVGRAFGRFAALLERTETLEGFERARALALFFWGGRRAVRFRWEGGRAFGQFRAACSGGWGGLGRLGVLQCEPDRSFSRRAPPQTGPLRLPKRANLPTPAPQPQTSLKGSSPRPMKPPPPPQDLKAIAAAGGRLNSRDVARLRAGAGRDRWRGGCGAGDACFGAQLACRFASRLAGWWLVLSSAHPAR
jgi:hypothetical protein